MYQPYPTSGQEPVPQRPEPPAPILTAVKLMYVGAALSAIELIVSVATVHSLRSAILKDFPRYTAHQVHTAEVGLVVVAVLEGLIAIGLWLWMARANRAGKNWARIVSSILFAFSTLSFFVSLSRAHSAITLLFAGIVWLVGLGAIVLIWRRDSSAYYQSQ
jgi:ABC-type transport system involved in cytochrome bd biosynthesis fused ATPase/permease subunit